MNHYTNEKRADIRPLSEMSREALKARIEIVKERVTYDVIRSQAKGLERPIRFGRKTEKWKQLTSPAILFFNIFKFKYTIY